MSAYPSGQRCPRCQYPVPPGATSCANCGLVFASPLSATPGANPAYPPQQQGSGSYSTPPASEGFGPPQASPGSYSSSSQQPTVYSPQSTLDSAPTVASALYPQDPGGPGSYPSAYPGSQPPVGYPGSAPAYPGSQPQGGYPGSAPAYLGSQPQGGYPGPAPAYLGSQPQGSFGAPPIAPPPQPVQQKSGNGLKIALIALVILVILGAGGGVAAYILTRPKPVITVTSDYKVRSTYAGAAGTVFHITGQKFSGDSTITILLDGNQAPGTKTIQSDSDGNIKADVVVTPDWPTGNNHTLSARDASGYAPQTAATVAIVNQGEAGTPGPNGAPSDSKSFSLKVHIERQDAVSGDMLDPFNDTLQITGQPDPAGGTVCDPLYDDGQPHTATGTTSDGVAYKETYIFKCSGTYKSGKLSYTETATTFRIEYANGVTCNANTPFINQKLEGTFTSGTEINGTYSSDAINFVCTDTRSGQQRTIPSDPEKGTWTGSATVNA